MLLSVQRLTPLHARRVRLELKQQSRIERHLARATSSLRKICPNTTDIQRGLQQRCVSQDPGRFLSCLASQAPSGLQTLGRVPVRKPHRCEQRGHIDACVLAFGVCVTAERVLIRQGCQRNARPRIHFDPIEPCQLRERQPCQAHCSRVLRAQYSDPMESFTLTARPNEASFSNDSV